MKLTADFILQCAQYTNALKDRELDLRGYKIAVIENLGATLDQFDCLDLSDNDIRKLDGFPLLKRLKTLLLNNNRICRIAEGLEQPLPSLETIVLTNNNMQELRELDTLQTIKTLTSLSLLRNPVTNRPHYRLYVINKLPQLKVLDFQRVKQREREAAKRMFSGRRGQVVNGDKAKKAKTFVPGAPAPGMKEVRKPPEPSRDVTAIKAAIANATTLQEMQKLEMMLKSGQVPSKGDPPQKSDSEEMEQEEPMEVTNGS